MVMRPSPSRGDRLHVGDLFAHARDRRRPDLHHQLLRAFGSFAMVSAMRQWACEANPSSCGALGAELHDPRDGRFVSFGVAVVAAALERLPDPLAQVAPARERQERIDARAGVDDHPLAGSLRSSAAALALSTSATEARPGRLALEDRPRVLVRQHLPELGKERRQLLIDLREPLLLLRRVEPRAAPDEQVVQPFARRF